MPSNYRIAQAVESDPRGAGGQIEHIQATRDSLQRLLAILGLLADPVYYRDLLHLEGIMGPELDKENHIQNLTNAMFMVSQARDEKIAKLIDENQRLMKNHEIFEKNKKDFESEKKDFEKNRRERKDEYEKKERQFEKDYKRRELELEERFEKKSTAEEERFKKRVENAKKAAEKKVETTMQELKSKNGELEAQLAKSKSESGIEIERFKAMETVHRGTIRTLELRLQVVDPNHGMSRKPSTYYCKIFASISERIIKIVDDHFETVREDHIDIRRLLGQQHEFSEVSKIFNYASSSGAEVAVSLRKCGIRQFIASQIAQLFSKRLLIGKSDDMMHAVHGSPKLNKHEQTVWKLITVKALEDRDQFETLAKDMSAMITGKTESLIEKARQSRVKEELVALIKDVLELWDTARRDSCELKIKMDPPSTNDGTWAHIEHPALCNDGDGSSTATPTANGIKTESFALFPRITRESETESDNENNKLDVLHQGIGLFSDSPIFAMGLAEFGELKRELNSVHKRHASITSPTMTERPHLKVHTKPGGRNTGSV